MIPVAAVRVVRRVADADRRTVDFQRRAAGGGTNAGGAAIEGRDRHRRDDPVNPDDVLITGANHGAGPGAVGEHPAPDAVVAGAVRLPHEAGRVRCHRARAPVEMRVEGVDPVVRVGGGAGCERVVREGGELGPGVTVAGTREAVGVAHFPRSVVVVAVVGAEEIPVRLPAAGGVERLSGVSIDAHDRAVHVVGRQCVGVVGLEVHRVRRPRARGNGGIEDRGTERRADDRPGEEGGKDDGDDAQRAWRRWTKCRERRHVSLDPRWRRRTPQSRWARGRRLAGSSRLRSPRG